MRSESNYILRGVEEPSLCAGVDPTGSQLYADRCTLLVRREPLMTSSCAGKCEKFSTIPTCSARVPCTAAQTLRGSCDGIIMHPCATPGVTSHLLPDDTHLQLQQRDKSLEYKWESVSAQDVHSCDDTDDDDVITPTPRNPQTSDAAVASQGATTLVQVPVEPYYFKYGHARAPHSRVHFRQVASTDDLAPDVLSNCSTFKCASLSGALTK